MSRPAWDLGTRIVREIPGRSPQRPPTPPTARPASTTESGCGTYAGYQVHRRAKEAACPPCKKALAAYMADYRAAAGQGSPRQRATVRLRERHQQEWRQLLREEQARSD